MSDSVVGADLGTRDTLLNVKGLKKYYPIEKGLFRRIVGNVKAVDDVNLHIDRGETLGLVGESGCGKTTLGRCVVRAMEPTDGSIELRLPDNSVVDLAPMERKELRQVRRHFHMVFQDPFSSLDPRMTVYDIIAEPLKYNGMNDTGQIVDRVRELMRLVGLDDQHMKRYPHAFSGGQRQRIGIARSLAPNPSLVVCDESVSALDVSIQAQILNLLQELQQELKLTYLFIAHDLSVVEHVSDRVAVMYVGKLVELAETEELFLNPKHPYTEALLSAVPKNDPRVKMDRIILAGEVPNPANPPSGCHFHPRCRYAKELCKTTFPPLKSVGEGHYSSCHFAEELDFTGVDGSSPADG
jgi:peptide/nickel transport system ATP-binding protein